MENIRTQDIEKAKIFWAHGIDWCVMKVGKKWRLMDCFGNFPLFNTKKSAYEAAESFIFCPRE